LLSILGGLFASFLYGVASLLLALRGRRSWPNLFLIVATAATAVWALIAAAESSDWDVPIALLSISRVARDASWLAVIIAFLRQDNERESLWRWLAAIAITSITAELTFAIFTFSIATSLGIYLTLPLMEFVNSILGLILIENLLRNMPRQRAWSLKLMAIGLSALFGYDLLLRIPELLEGTSLTNFVAAEPLAYIMVLPLFIVTAIRNDSLKLQIHSSRNVAFQTAALLFAGILLQGAAAAAYYVRNFGGTPMVVLAIVLGFTAVIGLIIAASSHSVRSRLRLFISENFYNYKYDYRLEWQKFIHTLSLDQDTTGPERVLRTLTNLLDSPGGILWVRREGWRQFLPLAHWSLAERFGPIDANDTLLEAFADERVNFIVLSASNSAPAVEVWRSRFPMAWIAVPMRFKGDVIAFALLQKPRAARRLDWEDQNLIGLTALELGAHLFHEHTAQILADSQQMAEFNKRVTFAVHDLKNTAGQLKLIVKNAERFGDNPEFRTDMISTISHAADNLGRLIDKLKVTESAEVITDSVQGVVSISELMSRVAAQPARTPILLDRDAQMLSRTIKVKDPLALENALHHIVSNAVEASNDQGTVDLSVEEVDGCLKVHVTDHGIGMSDHFIAHDLFKPFCTTKQSGLGVGAYQARTIMRDMGGDLQVKSRVGAGTTVTLVIPIAVAAENRDEL
jgi:putative PEP-CTERM system histidine kinase